MSELKILIHIGHHLNVVNLLGACTKAGGEKSSVNRSKEETLFRHSGAGVWCGGVQAPHTCSSCEYKHFDLSAQRKASAPAEQGHISSVVSERLPPQPRSRPFQSMLFVDHRHAGCQGPRRQTVPVRAARGAAWSCLLPKWPRAALGTFPLKSKLPSLNYRPSGQEKVSGHESLAA